jgi:hypothetical protein
VTADDSLDSVPVATLQGIAESMESPELILASDTREEIRDAESHKNIYSESAEYSRDPNSIRRFNQDPAELGSLLQDAATRTENARVLLESGHLWEARISAAFGKLERHYVAARLWEYHEDVYMPRIGKQFER